MASDWSEERKIIRRFLRDPDGGIWEDAYLLNIWNEEQKRLDRQVSLLEEVEAIRVPPNYQMSYVHDCEWAFADQEGETYQCFNFHQQSGISHQNGWEGQVLGYTSASESDYGDHFTHPWEAWYVTDNIGDLVPIWFPEHFERMLACYWDRDSIDYIEYKDLQSNDMTYRTRQGVPAYLYRIDELSNEAHLYPIPSSPVWDDFDSEGVVMGVDGDSYSQNYGTLVDATGTFISKASGVSIDIIALDDNLFLIYRARPRDVAGDEIDYPAFVNKYIRYGVLETAYSANTDGKIGSLSDFWGWRKRIGIDALTSYKALRKTDRDYRLISQPSIKRGQRRARMGSYEQVFGTTGITTS